MNRYLPKLKRLLRDSAHPQQPSKPSKPGFEGFEGGRTSRFLENEAKRLYGATVDALERRCPDYVDEEQWHEALIDSHEFLVQWGNRAAALGWSAQHLFGLATVPKRPAPSYRRLSRYDQTGLLWLLRGRPVVALTKATAAIENSTGAITIYRKTIPRGPGNEDVSPLFPRKRT